MIITVEYKEKMEAFISKYLEEIRQAYKLLVKFRNIKVVLLKDEDE